MLIVVSGPDRVGKSTLIGNMVQEFDGEVFVSHHGAPPRDQDNIFDFYKRDVEAFVKSDAKLALFDRAWPCSYILEQHRCRNAGHFEDLIDFEIWLNDEVGGVCHLAQLRPWHWSAPLYIEELREEFPDAAEWFIRDEYVARMQEHKHYTQELLNFYEDVSMFPNVVLTESVKGRDALAKCQLALQATGS